MPWNTLITSSVSLTKQVNNKAIVIATYGKYSLIEIDNQHYNCTARREVVGIVVGDRVAVDNAPDPVITKILTRKNLLTANHKNIVSNIDKIFLVLAIKPYPQLISIDNYLIKAQSNNIKISILINKSDLGVHKNIKNLAKIYTNIGYCVDFISVSTQHNINLLMQKIVNNACVFVGQSGVGKSSIVNLITGNNQKVDILGTNGLGKHTTTNSQIFYLKNNGKIIDTPGVREFKPQDLTKNEISNGFIEFKAFATLCKFYNCSHINEPQCEVKKQLELGNISRYRYKNYQQLMI